MRRKIIKDRPLLLFGLVYLVGTVFGVSGDWPWLIFLLVLGSIFLYDPFCEKNKKDIAVRGLLLLTVFGLSAHIASMASNARCQNMKIINTGRVDRVYGYLYKKEIKNEKICCYLKNCSFVYCDKYFSCNKVLLYIEDDNISIGDIVEVEGKPEIFKPARNEGNFDARSFYWSQNIDFSVAAYSVKVIDSDFWSLGEYLYDYKIYMADCFSEAMGDENAGTLTSMILGIRTQLDAEIKESYQRSGISHILAISGLHISFIGMGLYNLLRKRRFSFCLSMFISLSFVFLYGNMVGFSVSTYRAIGMLVMAQLAQLIGRSYDMLNSLGLMLMLILFDNPFVFQYSGFQFSFMAIVGVSFVGSSIAGQKDRDSSFFQKVYSTIAMSLGISLCTFPIVAYYYFEIPLFSFVLNLIVLPILSLVIADGFLALLLEGGFGGVNFIVYRMKDVIFFDRGLIDGVIGFVLLPARIVLSIYNYLSEIYGALPFSNIGTGQISVRRIVIYYSLLFVYVMVYRFVLDSEQVKGVVKFTVGGVFAFSLLGLLVTNPHYSFGMDFVDVGQGDGIYFSSDNGQKCFVDGGSSSVNEVGKYRISPFLKSKGVEVVDYWFISHGDRDHYNGLSEVIDTGIDIENIVLAKYMVRDDSYNDILSIARDNNIKIIEMNCGDKLVLGSTTIEALYPWDELYDDKNEQSLVMKISYEKFAALLLGDVSSEVEELIVDRYNLSDVDLIKISHHGSKFSSSEKLFSGLKARVAIISVGEKNLYGHPSVEALERIEDSGMNIYMTKNSGQISVFIGNQGLGIEEYVSLHE